MPCSVGDNINVKVMADVNPAAVDQYPYNNISYVTYGFCPVVDDLEALHVKGFVNDTMLNDTGIFGSNTTVYLRMYGLGSSSSVQLPVDTDAASAVLAQAGICGDGEIAIVNFLVLNITMKDGLIHYRDNLTPLFTGFQSTCQGGVCLFGPAGSQHPCIGNGQSSNCAQCYANTTNLQNFTVSIWTSFYGTDKDGTPFTSGEDNPLNFRQFALDSAYDSIANDVSIP